mgnify:FL=1
MIEPAWEAIACERSLGRVALRILILVSTSLAKGNKIPYTQKEIAEKLGVVPSAVTRPMQQLVRGGLVLQRGRSYWLNSRLVTKDRNVKDVLVVRHEEVKELQEIEAKWAREYETQARAPHAAAGRHPKKKKGPL